MELAASGKGPDRAGGGGGSDRLVCGPVNGLVEGPAGLP